MKKILLTSIALSISTLAFAQSTVISDRLQFAGTNTLNTSLTHGQIISYNWGSLRLASRSNATGKHISFHTGIGAIERLRILDNGSIGIGTSTPSAKLDVQQTGGSSGSATSLRLRSGNSSSYFGNNQILLSYAGTQNYSHTIKTRHHGSMAIGNSIDFYTWQPSDGIGNVGSNLVMSLNGGNVGIGVSSPEVKLDINQLGGSAGNHTSLRLRSGNSSSYYGNNQVLLSYSGSTDYSHVIRTRHNATSSNDNSIDFYVWKPEDGITNIGSQHVMSLNGGKVGIGTTSPTEKLSVDGTVLAKKVRVSTTGADWPDYVFAESYQLMAISQLEKYIQANQHLPEVPSAKEIQEKGQDLGDIQTTLLKKVEELTLYVIQLEAGRQKLEVDNSSLKTENSELKTLFLELKKEIESIKAQKQ